MFNWNRFQVFVVTNCILFKTKDSFQVWNDNSMFRFGCLPLCQNSLFSLRGSRGIESRKWNQIIRCSTVASRFQSCMVTIIAHFSLSRIFASDQYMFPARLYEISGVRWSGVPHDTIFGILCVPRYMPTAIDQGTTTYSRKSIGWNTSWKPVLSSH